jgi:hypothetical protein
MKKPSKPASQRARRRRVVARVRAHYDFRGGVRGKYAKRVVKGTYLVLLDPDLATEFRSERAVNDALRAYLRERKK